MFMLPCLILLLLNPFTTFSFPVTIRSDKCPVKLPDPPSAPDVTPPQPAPVLPDGAFPAAVRQPRIINGDLASERLRPYMVLFISSDGFFSSSCTGTLLSPRWIVTAAHCEITTSTGVWVGVTGLQTSSFQSMLSIETVFNHPRYNGEVDDKHDIALVKLAEDVTDGKFMSVNADSAFPKEKEFVRAIGYGTSRPPLFPGDEPTEGFGEEGWLRQVDMPTSTRRDCTKYPGLDFSFQTCAGYERGGCSPCFGDSGGPLIRYNDQKPVLVGVTSFGALCAAQDAPTVFIRTSAYISWFEQVGVEFTSESGGGLGAGTIVGIVIAVVVAAVLAAALIVFFLRKKRSYGTDVHPVAPVYPADMTNQGPTFMPTYAITDGSGVAMPSPSQGAPSTGTAMGQYSPPANIQAPVGIPQVPIPVYHPTSELQFPPQQPQVLYDPMHGTGLEPGQIHNGSLETGQVHDASLLPGQVHDASLQPGQAYDASLEPRQAYGGSLGQGELGQENVTTVGNQGQYISPYAPQTEASPGEGQLPQQGGPNTPTT